MSVCKQTPKKNVQLVNCLSENTAKANFLPTWRQNWNNTNDAKKISSNPWGLMVGIKNSCGVPCYKPQMMTKPFAKRSIFNFAVSNMW